MTSNPDPDEDEPEDEDMDEDVDEEPVKHVHYGPEMDTWR
jgi:hypothetical protein